MNTCTNCKRRRKKMAEKSSSPNIEEPAPQTFVVTRVFDAPRALVFKAWTEPERLARWWGPKGFEMSVIKLELRAGGIFLYSQRSPTGVEMYGKFIYREITPPED